MESGFLRPPLEGQSEGRGAYSVFFFRCAEMVRFQDTLSITFIMRGGKENDATTVVATKFAASSQVAPVATMVGVRVAPSKKHHKKL